MSKEKTPARAKKTKPVPDKPASDKPVLLAGDNPQIPKGEGDAPVQAFIEAVPGWKQDIVRRVDALIVKTVPGVRKAVKWNSPLYGEPGEEDWFLSYHCFTRYLKVTFFRGSSLDPVPPGTSKHAEIRYLDIHQDDAFEDQFVDWVKQARKLPGQSL